MADGSSGGAAAIPGPVEGASGELEKGTDGHCGILFSIHVTLAGGNTSYDTFDEEGEGEGELLDGDVREGGRDLLLILPDFYQTRLRNHHLE